MAWTDRATKSAGDIPIAAEWNESIANENYLLNPNSATFLDTTSTSIAGGTTQYSTSSTSFTDIDATDLSHTIETHGGPVLVNIGGVLGAGTYLDLAVDGTRIGDSTNGLRKAEGATQLSVNITYIVPASSLTAGSHTFKLQYKVASGTGYFYTGPESNVPYNALFFQVIEL